MTRTSGTLIGLQIPRSRLYLILGLFLVCAFHLGVRLYVVNDQGLFYEETTTWSYGQSVTDAVTGAALDVHPPLYFLFMTFWSQIVGTSEIALRLPSIIFSFLTLLTLMVFAGKLDGRSKLNQAIAVGILFACLPYDIYLSKTARSWTLVTFLCTLFTYLYLTATLLEKRSRLVASTIVAVFAAYVHYITLPFLAATVAASIITRPTRENIRFALITAGVVSVCLMPWLLFTIAGQLAIKANIFGHWVSLWEAGVVTLLAPINPSTWKPFAPIEESLCAFHVIGLFVALAGAAVVIAQAHRCWANLLTRALIIQMGAMILFLLLSPMALCNQRTMCVFLPSLILLLSYSLARCWRSRSEWNVVIAYAFVVAFVATSLSGFPYRMPECSLREICDVLRPSLSTSRHSVALLSPANHLLTFQYLQSRGAATFARTIVAPYPVVVLLSPWYEHLHPEILRLPPKEVWAWHMGPHDSFGMVWTLNDFFARNGKGTEVIFFREGSLDLFGRSRPGTVNLGALKKEARFTLTRIGRYGTWAVYRAQQK